MSDNNDIIRLKALMPNTVDGHVPVVVYDPTMVRRQVFRHSLMPGIDETTETKQSAFDSFKTQVDVHLGVDDISPIYMGILFHTLSGVPDVAAGQSLKQYEDLIEEVLVSRVNPEVVRWTVKYVVLVDDHNVIEGTYDIRRNYAKVHAYVTVADLVRCNQENQRDWLFLRDVLNLVTLSGTFFYPIKYDVNRLGRIPVVTPSMLHSLLWTPGRNLNDKVRTRDTKFPRLGLDCICDDTDFHLSNWNEYCDLFCPRQSPRICIYTWGGFDFKKTTAYSIVDQHVKVILRNIFLHELKRNYVLDRNKCSEPSRLLLEHMITGFDGVSDVVVEGNNPHEHIVNQVLRTVVGNWLPGDWQFRFDHLLMNAVSRSVQAMLLTDIFPFNCRRWLYQQVDTSNIEVQVEQLRYVAFKADKALQDIQERHDPISRFRQRGRCILALTDSRA